MGDLSAAPAPAGRRTWKARLLRAAKLLGLAYIILLAVLSLLEDSLVFRACSASDFWVGPPDDVPVRDVGITSGDGTRLHAWWAEPPGWQPGAGALLFCHGSNGNLSLRGHELKHWLDHGLAVLLFDYPGFGKSEGTASEAGCYAAGDACFDWLVAECKVPAERIVLYGGSLGSGVAVDLAVRRPHRALVLVSAYTSIPDMAQRLFPWAPVRWLTRNQFNNLAKIAQVTRPVIIAHGPADRLIPFSQGQRLFAAVPAPKAFLTMLDYRHKDFPKESDYPALVRLLDEKAPLHGTLAVGRASKAAGLSAAVGPGVRSLAARVEN